MIKISNVKTSHKNIFNYWKDKCISENGEIYIEGKYNFQKSIPVIEDWGEPSCWCCGKFTNKIYNHLDYEHNLSNAKFSEIWEYKETKSLLNRCHIIPNMLGGEDTPKNLFLLCEFCHRNSPDTNNPRLFFRWIYKQRTKCLYENGISISQYIDELLDECKFQNKDLSTIAFNSLDDNVGTHSGKISPSSIIMILVDSAKPNIYHC